MVLRFPEGQRPKCLAVTMRPLRSEPAWQTEPLEWDAKTRAFRIELHEPPGGLMWYLVCMDDLAPPWLWPNPEVEIPYQLSR